MATPSPQQQITQLLTGYWLAQALYVAAKLGVADLLKGGPRSAEDLASATRAHPRALYRLLRALASVGVFAQDDQGRFALTPPGECLRSGVPGSQRALALMNGEEHYRAWGELLYSVQTGKPAFEKLFGLPVFDFLSLHPDQARVFDEAMVGVHGRETAAMLDAYDFSGLGVLADVGGGNGSVLTAVLQKYPDMRGILYDLPGVVERARPHLQAAGLRTTSVCGGSSTPSSMTSVRGAQPKQRGMLVGHPAPDGRHFVSSDLSPEQALHRIEQAWSALGRAPNIGEAAWFTSAQEAGG